MLTLMSAECFVDYDYAADSLIDFDDEDSSCCYSDYSTVAYERADLTLVIEHYCAFPVEENLQ